MGGGLAQSNDGGRNTLHAAVWTGMEGKAGAYWLSSDDGGVTWPRRKLLDPKGHHADVAAHGSAVALAWDGAAAGGPGIRVALSADGREWKDAGRFGATGRASSHPRLVTTSDGFLLAWTEAAGEARTAWRSVRIPLPDR